MLTVISPKRVYLQQSTKAGSEISSVRVREVCSTQQTTAPERERRQPAVHVTRGAAGVARHRLPQDDTPRHPRECGCGPQAGSWDVEPH